MASQAQVLEDQFSRGEILFKQLEQRRTQVAFGEKKLAAVESRLADIKVATAELDKNIEAMTKREEIIAAVKAELEQVHQIGAKAKADLTHITQHREDVTNLKLTVDALLSRIGETDERMQSIDSQRKVVDEVNTKANTILHLLDDVRIGLETLGEQKAVVDHAVEQVNKLEFTLEDEARRKGGGKLADVFLSTGLALVDPGLSRGSIVQRLDAELAPGSRAAAFRARAERRVNADRSFENFAQFTDQRSGSLRWRLRAYQVYPISTRSCAASTS